MYVFKVTEFVVACDSSHRKVIDGRRTTCLVYREEISC